MIPLGAMSFITTATGDTVHDAFQTAVADAQYAYGHAGYTGTIAEKDAARDVQPPAELTTPAAIIHWAEHLLDDEIDDPALYWINDKWGPAAAVRLDATTWLFFGWASS